MLVYEDAFAVTGRGRTRIEEDQRVSLCAACRWDEHWISSLVW